MYTCVYIQVYSFRYCNVVLSWCCLDSVGHVYSGSDICALHTGCMYRIM